MSLIIGDYTNKKCTAPDNPRDGYKNDMIVVWWLVSHRLPSWRPAGVHSGLIHTFCCNWKGIVREIIILCLQFKAADDFS
jgi:hypothetical protein